ncbi:MAG: MerR family transcriptional regulator [Thiolinea sp.]
MFTVSEVAKQTGISAHTVRYYVREGLLEPSEQAANQYRLFSPKAVSRLRFIRTAKILGFTLNEIRQILEHAGLGESPCADVREIIQQHIVENRRRIEEMQQLQQRMEQALDKWQDMPNRTPDGHSICHLIESMSGIEGKE